MLLVDKMTSVNSLHSSSGSSEQVVRKKRTFDIAFLTGQDNSDKDKEGSSSSDTVVRLTNPNSLAAVQMQLEENNSNSSIDVTNGSVSDQSEPPRSPPLPLPRKSNKIRSNNRKDEIRFESKRTIDINQTSDSVKIKENLQFSTLFPTSAVSSISGSSGNGSVHVADLHLPHISTFALLPHMTKFPVSFPMCPTAPTSFSAKMEKSECINISYPMNKIRAGNFPDPYAAALANNYYNPNLMLPQDLNSRQNFPGGQNPHSHHQQQPHHHPSGGGGQNNSNNPVTTATAVTLLPPSLTALTLPAQNVCAKCNIGFRMTSDLVYHMRSHHKRDCDPMKKKREDKLKCPVCHESFRERHHLTRHMTAHQDRAEERDESSAALKTLI